MLNKREDPKPVRENWILRTSKGTQYKLVIKVISTCEGANALADDIFQGVVKAEGT